MSGFYGIEKHDQIDHRNEVTTDWSLELCEPFLAKSNPQINPGLLSLQTIPTSAEVALNCGLARESPQIPLIAIILVCPVVMFQTQNTNLRVTG